MPEKISKTVTAISATIERFAAIPLDEPHKRRVAGYARVSTDQEEQLTSYEAQVDYYTKYIKNHADWEFVEIYTDEGISATNTIHREGFKRMVADALDGKIDLIVTKSVSRFARNTVDSLTTVRQLKEKGIEVYFEKENIWTLDSKGELLITIMSSLAQEESRSISENCTWGQRKRFSDGKVTVPFTNFLGYDRGEDGNLVVNEEQAQVVRHIFEMFLTGMTSHGISTRLTEEGIPSPGRKPKWSGSTVSSILQNEKYKGDALLQKMFTANFLTKKMKKNKGEIPQYYVKNNHEAIIDPATFDFVQTEIKKRGSCMPGQQYSGMHIFSGKIYCGQCGAFFCPKTWHSNNKYRKTVWRCNLKYSGEKKCSSPHLYEEDIQRMFVTAVNQLLSEKDQYISGFTKAQDAICGNSSLESEKSELESEIEILTTMIRQLIQGNANSAINQSEYHLRYNKMIEQFDTAQARLDQVNTMIFDKECRKKGTERFLKELKKQKSLITEFDPYLWSRLVDHVTVYSKDDIRFTFRDGTVTGK